MKTRFPDAVLGLALVLLLGGCASEPSGGGVAGGGVAGGGVGGTWIVTDAFASGAVTDIRSAPRGQMVRLDADMAGDAAGRACPWPSYAQRRAPLAAVIGAAAPDWPGMAETVTVLDVSCAGQPFATYAALADGSLLSRYGGWLLRLEPGEKLAANPAPMTPDAVAAPLPLAAAPPPAAAPVPEAPRKLVYLASYKTEAWARKGWGILAGRSASLKGLEPVMRNVEIKGKGRFVRLFAAARDDADGKRLCRELGKAISECGVSGREG